jgi:STE24 endopeptidase
MKPAWAAGAITALALLAALLLAFISRAPADVRRAGPGPGATDSSLGADFTDEQVARHGAYREASYTVYALSLLVEVAVLVILLRGPAARAVEWLQRVPGGWAVRAALLGAIVSVVLGLAAIPLGYVFGYVVQHAWGLSNQDLGDWLGDRARTAAITAGFAAGAAVAFFGVVRWQPRSWWLWGWAVFTLLTAALAFLWPVLIAPLFNRFTPLPEGSLRTRVLHLADQAGVNVGEVYVIDASKRSTIENAYVAGLGSTKQMVLFDTLIEADDEDATAFVVAHELGHQVESHVFKNVLIASAGMLVGFGMLAWLAGRPGVLSWAGASGISDLRVLPAILLFVLLANLIALPVQNLLSRRFEARADEIALQLTDDPATARRVFRRLAFANLADLRPPQVAVAMLFTHPPITSRINSAASVARGTR